MTAALLAFDNQGGAPEEPSTEPMRFLPVDYQKDFEFVRHIDDSFDPRFGKQAKTKPATGEDEGQSPE